MKKLTVGCRARITGHCRSFDEYKEHEVLLVERSGPQFSVMVLGEGKNISLKKMDKNTVINEIAWLVEAELEFVDDDFATNLDFIDWYQENEEDFCPDCGEWLGNLEECPSKECDFGR